MKKRCWLDEGTRGVDFDNKLSIPQRIYCELLGIFLTFVCIFGIFLVIYGLFEMTKLFE